MGRLRRGGITLSQIFSDVFDWGGDHRFDNVSSQLGSPVAPDQTVLDFAAISQRVRMLIFEDSFGRGLSSGFNRCLNDPNVPPTGTVREIIGLSFPPGQPCVT